MLGGERMTRPVVTITPDTPVPEALSMMKREHIRRLPVMDRGELVGIVSDKDLYNATPSPATTLSVWEMSYLLAKLPVKEIMTRQELLGGREAGVRVTLLLAERKGELARLTRAIYEAGGNIVALGASMGEDPSNRRVTAKVSEVQRGALVEAVES